MASIRKDKSCGSNIHNLDILNTDNMIGVGKKRYRRKVRATEDFNHLNRSSLDLDSNVNREGLYLDKKKTRKQKAINFLSDVWAEKENFQLTSETSSDEVVEKRKQHQLKKFIPKTANKQSSLEDSELEFNTKRKNRKVKNVEPSINDYNPSKKATQIAKNLDGPMTRNGQNRDNMNINITDVNNRSSSSDISHDEILNRTYEVGEPTTKQDISNIELRKSVRFLSPLAGHNNHRKSSILPVDVSSNMSNGSDSKIESKILRKSTPHVKKFGHVNIDKKNMMKGPLEYSTEESQESGDEICKTTSTARNVSRLSSNRKKSKLGLVNIDKKNMMKEPLEYSTEGTQESGDEICITTSTARNVSRLSSNRKKSKLSSSKYNSPFLSENVMLKTPKLSTTKNGIKSILRTRSSAAIDTDYNISKSKFYNQSTINLPSPIHYSPTPSPTPSDTKQYSIEESQESGDEICKTTSTAHNVSRLSHNRKKSELGSVEYNTLKNNSPFISENVTLKTPKHRTTKNGIISSLRTRSSVAIDTHHNISKSKFHNQSTINLPSPIHYCSIQSPPPSDTKQDSVIDLITPTPKKGELFAGISGSPLPSSIGTDTFSFDNIHTSKLASNDMKSENNYSGTTEIFNSNDEDIPEKTSKVQKRKRWNKSLGVSFLDSTGNLQTIQPPLYDESLPELVSGSEDDLKPIAHFQTPEQISHSVKKTDPCGSSIPRLRTRVKIGKEKTSKTININCISKPVTRIRMPNFALIHQKAYDKLENLKEMSERKAARAKQLLSGHKPNVNATLKSPSKSRKILKYSPKAGKTAIQISEPTTMKDKNMAKNVISNKMIVPSTSNPKVSRLPKTIQRKAEPTNLKSCIPKPTLKKVNEDKKTITRLGFKVNPEANKGPSKVEQLKAVSTKSKIINSVESRRNLVQNIRTNRRFELLMKMRNKK